MTRPLLRVALLIIATASTANAQARWRLVEELRLGGEEAGHGRRA